jgi:pre-rRNA-processing protein IPI3
MQEIVFSSSNQFIHAWDIRSTTLLGSFKSNSSQSFILSKNYLISPQEKSALIHVYELHKSALACKYVLPESLTCIALSHSQQYMVGGGQSGRIYLWKLSTGDLIQSFDAHFKSVNCALFTPDDQYLLTAGHDSLIQVYSISQLALENPRPCHTLTGHSLPIQDLKCSWLLSNDCRIFSVSLDKTCKIWNLNNGQCLATISFNTPLTSLALDPAERVLYTGSNTGQIYACPLYRSESGVLQMLQGVSAFTPENHSFVGHQGSIHSLSVSMDASLLVSGSSDGTAQVWDTSSCQSLQTFSHHTGPVKKVHVSIAPLNLFNPKTNCPKLPMLKRYPVPEFKLIGNSKQGIEPIHFDDLIKTNIDYEIDALKQKVVDLENEKKALKKLLEK